MAKFQSPGDKILDTVFSLAENSVPYQDMINASCAGDLKIINNSTGTYGIIVDKTDRRYHISTVSDENGKHTRLTPTYKASIFQIDAAAVGETVSNGDITSQYTSTMTDTFLSHLTDIYASVKGSEEKFSEVLERIETMGTGLPEKEIDPTALSPHLSKLHSRLETTRQNQPHILPALNEALTYYNETKGTDNTLFEYAKESYAAKYNDTTGSAAGSAGNSGPKIPLRQRLSKALPKILLGTGVAAVALSLGCTDKPDDDNIYDSGTHVSLQDHFADQQDAVNGYVEKNWFEDIFGVDVPDYENNQLYAMANGNDEKSGPPTPTPVTACAVATDIETGKITVYVEGNDPISLDKDNIPPGWEEHIIKDPSQLLHIEEIGKDKYEISGIAPSLEHDGYKYKIIYYDPKADDKPNHLTDAKIDTDDGKGEITSGFFVAENEEGVEQVYALFIADGEAKRQEISIKNGNIGNAKYINSFAEIPGFPGISSYVINMSDINKGPKGDNGASITSPGMMSELLDRKDDDYVHFSIVKEKL